MTRPNRLLALDVPHVRHMATRRRSRLDPPRRRGARLADTQPRAGVAVSCDKTLGCVYAANSLSCSDGDACTVGDGCKGGACLPGAVTKCDDGNPCTADACQPKSGECTFVPVKGCYLGACLANSDCKVGVCDVKLHACVPCLKSADCGSGLVCVDAVCVQGLTCISSVQCKALGFVCDALAAACVECIDDKDCADGMACIGRKCVDSPACTSSKNCPAQCDMVAKRCVECLVDEDCPDWKYCGADQRCRYDICAAPSCVGATLLTCAVQGSGFTTKSCDDGNVCTSDACMLPTGCTHTANELSCSDGNACTVADKCAASACGGTTPFLKLMGLDGDVGDALPLPDGGHIVGGREAVSPVPGPNGPVWGNRAFLRRIDKGGVVVWNHVFDPLYSIGTQCNCPAANPRFNDVAAGQDGSVVACGEHWASVAGNIVNTIRAVKVDANGVLLWSKEYGTGECMAIQDRGAAGSVLAWQNGQVRAIDAVGSVTWSAKPTEPLLVRDMVTTKDGGFVLVGLSDVIEYQSKANARATKLTATGTTAWTTTLGAEDGRDELLAVLELPSGDIVAGGRVDGAHYYSGPAWLVCLDPGGKVKWQQKLKPDMLGQVGSLAYDPVSAAIAAAGTIAPVNNPSWSGGSAAVWQIGVDGILDWVQTYTPSSSTGSARRIHPLGTTWTVLGSPASFQIQPLGSAQCSVQ